MLAESKGSPACSPSPQYAQTLPLLESAEGQCLSRPTTAQPCNRSAFGNSSISSGNGSPRTNLAGRPFRSSKLRSRPASTAAATRRDTTDLSSFNPPLDVGLLHLLPTVGEQLRHRPNGFPHLRLD